MVGWCTHVFGTGPDFTVLEETPVQNSTIFVSLKVTTQDPGKPSVFRVSSILHLTSSTNLVLVRTRAPVVRRPRPGGPDYYLLPERLGDVDTTPDVTLTLFGPYRPRLKYRYGGGRGEPGPVSVFWDNGKGPERS